MLFLTLHSFWGSVLFFLEYFSEFSSEAACEGNVQEDWNQSEFGLPVHALNKALAQGLALSGFWSEWEWNNFPIPSVAPEAPLQCLSLALPPSQHSWLEIMEPQGVTAQEVVFFTFYKSRNTISGLHVDLVKGSWRIDGTKELEVAMSVCHPLCDPAVVWEIPGPWCTQNSCDIEHALPSW